MRRILAGLLLVVMVGIAAGTLMLQYWQPHQNIPQVTLSRLNEGETSWYAAGITDYRLQVSVQFADERRRYEVQVVDGLFASASAESWVEDLGDWGPAVPAPEEEARFFTVPGMFEMLRQDLFNEEVERESLRMQISSGGYPETIFLGRIIQEGVPVDDTELLIEVLEFVPAD